MQGSPWWGLALSVIGALLAGAWLGRRLSHGAALAEREAEARLLRAQLDEARAQSASALAEARAEGERWRVAAEQARAQAARRDAELEHAQARLEAQRAWTIEQTERLRLEAQAIGRRLVDEGNEQLAATSQARVGEVLLPLREQLTHFKARVDAIHEADARDRSALRERLELLTQQSVTLSEQTHALSAALTRQSKAQGDWGELVLTRIFEAAGLTEGRDYRLQRALDGEDHRGMRPDAVLELPEGRQVVVDAKVSLTAWTRFASAEDAAARAAALADHVASVRQHIRALGSKAYQRAPGLDSVDFVLLFTPIEPALLEALRADERLLTEAYAQRVVLVTPTTLFAVVRMVDQMWAVHRRTEHAERLAEQGARLYDKLATFVETFDEVGGRLRRAQESFDQARRQLHVGKGNALRQAERLRELGVNPRKRLPAAPDAGDEGEDGDEQ